mgnify:CR=1 FL=1
MTLIAISDLEFSYSENHSFALKIPELSLEPGDCVGLIGENGSGKSTLLSLLTGIVEPKSGSISINGKIFSFLSLGSTLDISRSGFENLRSALQMYDIKPTDDLIAELSEFTELPPEILARNVDTYSSGMKARIAFAPLTIMQADIYLLDEILAVGDIKFQSKSYNALHKKIKSSDSCAIVSGHSSGSFQHICNKALWLKDGQIHEFGPAQNVCELYQEHVNQHILSQISPQAFSQAPDGPTLISCHFDSPSNCESLSLIVKFDLPSIAKVCSSESYVCTLESLDGFVLTSIPVSVNEDSSFNTFTFDLAHYAQEFVIISLSPKNDPNLEVCSMLVKVPYWSTPFAGTPLFYTSAKNG